MKKFFLLSLLVMLLSGSIAFASDSMYKKSNSTSRPSFNQNVRSYNNLSKPSANRSQRTTAMDLYELERDINNFDMEQRKELTFYKNNIRYCIKGSFRDYQVLGFQGDKCIMMHDINVENIHETYRCELPKAVLREYSQSMVDATNVFDIEKFSDNIDKQGNLFAKYCDQVK